MDEGEIEYERISETQLSELMARRLDRKISQIFLKTELFF